VPLSRNLGTLTSWNSLCLSRPVMRLLYLLLTDLQGAGIGQSVYRLTTGWAVWWSNSRIPSPVQTGPGTHPALYTMGTASFPRVKRLEHGVDHSSPCSSEIKERVELYLYSLSGSSCTVLGWTLPLPVQRYGVQSVALQATDCHTGMSCAIAGYFPALRRTMSPCSCQ